MGRQAPEGYMGRKDAARLLGVTVRSLELWCRQGLLVSSSFEGTREKFYRNTDVHLLLAARADKNCDIWMVKAIALQALAAARITEVRVAQVFDLLGLNVVPIHRDDASIAALACEMEEAPSRMQLRDVAWVRYWGGTFFAIEDTYLELAGHVLKDEEPWRRYIEFANRIFEAAHAEVAESLETNEALRLAYNYLRAAKTHLMQAGYLHCRRKYGRRTADGVFDGSVEAVPELVALLLH